MKECLFISCCSRVGFSKSYIHIPTKKHDYGITFRRNKSKHKNILASAVVAPGDGFSKGTLRMQNNLLVLGTDQMVHDVRSGGVSAGGVGYRYDTV